MAFFFTRVRTHNQIYISKHLCARVAEGRRHRRRNWPPRRMENSLTYPNGGTSAGFMGGERGYDNAGGTQSKSIHTRLSAVYAAYVL